MAGFNSTTSGPDPENFGADCKTYQTLDYDVSVVALAIVMGLFGLVYTFVGYRCFKAVMFLSGLIFGGTIVYIICQEERIVQHNLSFGAIVGISVGIGVLCGLITMLVIYVGLFLQGIFLGVLLAIGAILALSKFYQPSSPWVPLGILFGTGILFALFTLKWQKVFLVIGTSVMGAAMLCSCIQYFLGKFSLQRYIWVKLMAKPAEEECWFFVLILGLWPALSVLGILIQWRLTGKDFDHTDVIIWRDQRDRIRTHLVRQPNRTPSMDPLTSRRVRQRPEDRPNVYQGNSSRNLGPAPRPAQQNEGPLRVASAAANFDALPPSYDDCMKYGIGKPVKEGEHSRIIRTKHGSFLSPVTRQNDTGCSTPRTSSHLDQVTENRRSRRGRGRGASANLIPGRHRPRQRGSDRRSNSSGPNEIHGGASGGRRSRERRSVSNEINRRGSNRSPGCSVGSRGQRPSMPPSDSRGADDRQSLLVS